MKLSWFMLGILALFFFTYDFVEANNAELDKIQELCIKKCDESLQSKAEVAKRSCKNNTCEVLIQCNPPLSETKVQCRVRSVECGEVRGCTAAAAITCTESGKPDPCPSAVLCRSDRHRQRCKVRAQTVSAQNDKGGLREEAMEALEKSKVGPCRGNHKWTYDQLTTFWRCVRN